MKRSKNIIGNSVDSLAENTPSPFISIIVATLNNSQFLQQCIESIISQTYTHKEVIVIDGGSTDLSLKIIKKLDHDINYWESKPDRGIYHAWNKALKHAKGDWVCFLGADDFFHDENVLTSLAPHLQRAETQGINAVYGKVTKVDHKGIIIRVEGKPWDKVGWLMRHGMPIPHPGLMHHKSIFETRGLFDESFRIAGDYDLLLRELKDGKAMFVDTVLTVVCRIGGVADSRSIETHNEVARARKKLGLPFSWIWVAVHFKAHIRSVWRRLYSTF
ncbi:MAG: glycosyltransferase [Proteobacteria bacterium]|nr:glycosyltransferase [Pseudomonadota bacterium]MBU1709835.1 glycosyltransferase [Pseudomonadota bacterium]